MDNTLAIAALAALAQATRLETFRADYATGATSWGNMAGLGPSDGNRQLCTSVGDKYRA